MIHPLTYIHPEAKIAQHVKIDPFSTVHANVEIGDKVKIKGTVKGSDEYKDVYSTVLTRCKFV
jgi:acyl-[acyl carrier protein]--UDP-N-acetylglucosamine O-acyltransferase